MGTLRLHLAIMRGSACLAVMFTLNACATGGYYPVAIPRPVAKLMIFGGTNHTVYLGCLNCSEYATDSVKNQYGTHGSAFSQESILNHYGSYGSPYAATSACNPYASDPPVIVDQGGRYYGRLTLNAYHPQIGSGTGMMGWLAAVCQN